MESNKMDVVILTGRPAAGKSEIIAYLKSLPRTERLHRFGLGDIEEIDDFRFVWETFQVDDSLEKHGRQRIFTTPDYFFKDDDQCWSYYIARINEEFKNRTESNPYYFEGKTLFIEFSRGGDLGLRKAFECLDKGILKRAHVVYLNISYQESVRKNEMRARPGEEGSTLHHSLPLEKLARYYKIDDWDKVAQGKEGWLSFQNIQFPFAVFDNESDQTSDLKKIGSFLEDGFSRLRWQSRQAG